ncbi:MAG TPA: chemotaxis protein CheA [Cytophagaceae bacterium]|jgi:two-component system chemotaxis sensor kinase CheA|nr:chemotaxis protein CheA [Cytophagaceae bacterium]
MDQFRIKFLEEAADLLDDLEKILLELEKDGISTGSIEHIFRVMHTIKGSSSMFGFDVISEFTHHLETIYDLIRSGKMKVSKEILDATLVSVDHIRKLLTDENLSNPENISNHKSIGQTIKALIGAENIAKERIAFKEIQEHENSFFTYYILFKPTKDILIKGNNPLFLLSDLQDMGESKVLWHMQEIPDFIQLNPKECDICWEIFLACKESSSEVRDVFIFVEDQSELIIEELAKENLFIKKKFVEHLDNIPYKSPIIDLTDLKDFIQGLKEDESKQKKKKERSIENKTDKSIINKEGIISSIRVSSDKLDDLMNLVSELVTTQARLSLYANNNIAQNELSAIAENIEKISRQLRDNTFSICLIPIENMLTRFQRLIRDLSGQLDKKIIFLSEGTDTEIDKTIVEKLTDPLMHIFRNCIDHGIENKETRIEKGKPEEGTISFRAFYSGTNVHIEIKDDGGGINPAKIREKAISKGLIAPEIQLSEKEIIDLMFLPGFSTATHVTEVSGRGVGMDVVKRQINAIRGSVHIESVIDKGTTITLILPLTLSIIDGLLVQIHNTKYVIPLSVVDKCYEVKSENILNLFDNILDFEGGLIPFFNLREEFGIKMTPPEIQQVIIVKHNARKIGITVDYVIGEYQAVLKPLGKLYQNTDIMSGATILGDGSIALVMDTVQIVKKFSARNVI